MELPGVRTIRRSPMPKPCRRTLKRLNALFRSAWFFFRILGRRDYDGRMGVGHSLYCSRVIFDMWMGRLDAKS
jgi:hypothetical protein